MMLEAGSDARVKNKGGLTAGMLCDPKMGEVRRVLEERVVVEMGRGDFVEEGDGDDVVQDHDDVASDSGSDFDREEQGRK